MAKPAELAKAELLEMMAVRYHATPAAIERDSVRNLRHIRTLQMGT